MNESIDEVQLATFAGGCFWCMVKPFDELPGVVSIVSGYTGGHTDNPTYEEVGSETTGHAEAVQIQFQPAIFSYRKLLDLYWQLIDPTDRDGQFEDRGRSYRTAIFYHNNQQHEEAELSKQALKASGRFKQPIATEILPAAIFYPAEDDHQNYYKTHYRHYSLYYDSSGRNQFYERNWASAKDKSRLQKQLSALQFEVTQNRRTEPAYQNDYWNQTERGLYVDIVNGDPLFHSDDQFDSGSGWPSFRKPINEGFIRREADLSGGQVRTSVQSRLSHAHLGYLIFDSSVEGGSYYCVNSAAMHFIPEIELIVRGYGRYTDNK